MEKTVSIDDVNLHLKAVPFNLGCKFPDEVSDTLVNVVAPLVVDNLTRIMSMREFQTHTLAEAFDEYLNPALGMSVNDAVTHISRWLDWRIGIKTPWRGEILPLDEHLFMVGYPERKRPLDLRYLFLLISKDMEAGFDLLQDGDIIKHMDLEDGYEMVQLVSSNALQAEFISMIRKDNDYWYKERPGLTQQDNPDFIKRGDHTQLWSLRNKDGLICLSFRISDEYQPGWFHVSVRSDHAGVESPLKKYRKLILPFLNEGMNPFKGMDQTWFWLSGYILGDDLKVYTTEEPPQDTVYEEIIIDSKFLDFDNLPKFKRARFRDWYFSKLGIPDNYEFNGDVEINLVGSATPFPKGMVVNGSLKISAGTLDVSGLDVRGTLHLSSGSFKLSDDVKFELLVADQCPLKFPVAKPDGVPEVPAYADIVRGNFVYTGPNKRLPAGLVVEGDLRIFGGAMDTLPEGLVIKGSLDISSTSITHLPDDIQVGKDIIAYRSHLAHLGGVKHVKGDLDLSMTPIHNLDRGLIVDGNLNLSATVIDKLPRGLKVGGNLILIKSYAQSVPLMASIGGDVIKDGNAYENNPDAINRVDRWNKEAWYQEIVSGNRMR